tara:strand:+ start:438 stop:1310 length:873 start_codon:yes stop_codon:yes gene_type:complete
MHNNTSKKPPEKPIAFNNADNAQTYANFIDGSASLWMQLSDIAQKNQASPTRIIDLGGGPGEPGCHFAAKYREVPTIVSDKSPAMVEQAKLRVSAKGLNNVECMMLDMQDLRTIGDGSVDLVISSQSYQFCPDKLLALRETFRVMKPGGLLLANVWEQFDMMTICSGLMQAVTGQEPDASAAPSPVGPLGLADPALFDSLLKDTGFEFAEGHNTSGSYRANLGNLSGEQAFKMSAMPICSKLSDFETDGTHPRAWAIAKAAFPKICESFVDAEGNVYIGGRYRTIAVRKI